MSSGSRLTIKQILAEVFLIFAVFFTQGAWPVPDVNEPYYLAKAIHFWNPTWVSGDFFLDTADTHEVFCFTFGWLSLWLSPTMLAWTGRLLTWWLMAWAWRRMSFAYLPRRWVSVVTAGVFVCLSERCHMAGEWVIGGVEAKGFAFILVFLALEALARNRWNRVWLLLGAASAFHVLVGGWAVVAAILAWATLDDRPGLGSMALAMVVGFLLSLPGLVPSLDLTTGADSDTLAQAYTIYVFGRLGHHLAPAYIPADFIYRFVGLVVLWILLELAIDGDEPRRRLRRFVGASVGIAIAGMIVSLFVRMDQTMVAALLRFYWFRLSDVAVPLGVAFAVLPFASRWLAEAERWWPAESRWRRWTSLGVLTAAVILAGLLARGGFLGLVQAPVPQALALQCGALVVGVLLWLGLWSLPLSPTTRRLWQRAPLCACAMVILLTASVHLGNCFVQRMRRTVPRADRLYQYFRPEDRLRDYRAWRDACQWVATSGQIPDDARLLTPRTSQTFKWYAGRPEVANWKEIPQDAASIVEWWNRINDVFASGSGDSNKVWRGSMGELGAHRLRELGHKYRADYAITRLWPWVYGMEVVYRNDMYVIYRLGAG